MGGTRNGNIMSDKVTLIAAFPMLRVPFGELNSCFCFWAMAMELAVGIRPQSPHRRFRCCTVDASAFMFQLPLSFLASYFGPHSRAFDDPGCLCDITTRTPLQKLDTKVLTISSACSVVCLMKRRGQLNGPTTPYILLLYFLRSPAEIKGSICIQKMSSSKTCFRILADRALRHLFRRGKLW
ncbi:hypothetical protein MLD38_005700 [Melastoma candidum]|uniref:Uncharacterized protein n=1 Tax=Melastoma candidum TaxID=119954 RepID=A0ACB9RK92_9MYRT|nr:hypothetical protein MLD38_005700 [Melastoma candidum]